MHLTVAVCTWNRCEFLQKTLHQLLQVRVPSGVTVRFLVVNNNSTDATESVIDAFADRLPLHRLFVAEPGVVHARNAAISWATGDYVAFVDDDALADESWIAALVAATRAFPDAAAFGGVVEPWFVEQPDRDFLDAFPYLKQGFCGLDHHRPPGPLEEGLFVYGPNMAYRLAALGRMRFDPSLGGTPLSSGGGDEPELLRRLRAAGHSVVWWPEMKVRHYVEPRRQTLEYLLRFAEAKGREMVMLSSPSSAPQFLNMPRWLVYRYFGAVARYLESFIGLSEAPAFPRPFSGPIESKTTQRARRLSWRRELGFLRGMLRGHRERHLRDRAGNSRLNTPSPTGH